MIFDTFGDYMVKKVSLNLTIFMDCIQCFERNYSTVFLIVLTGVKMSMKINFCILTSFFLTHGKWFYQKIVNTIERRYQRVWDERIMGDNFCSFIRGTDNQMKRRQNRRQNYF